MNIYQSADQLIGKTPLLELSHLEKKYQLEAHIFAKLEYFNPTGSVKDRIAKAMIDDAEERRHLTPGGVIIEPTSGNTGIGLASVGSARGYRVIIVMPETMSIEKYNLTKNEHKSDKWFDVDKIKGDLNVRSRRPGDKINISVGNKKLKTLFIDMKIPKEERCRIPILVDEEDVLSVGTYRVSEKFKVDESTREVLKVCFKTL